MVRGDTNHGGSQDTNQDTPKVVREAGLRKGYGGRGTGTAAAGWATRSLAPVRVSTNRQVLKTRWRAFCTALLPCFVRPPWQKLRQPRDGNRGSRLGDPEFGPGSC